MRRLLKTAALALLLMPLFTQARIKAMVEMKYGKNNRIEFDQRSGKYRLFHGDLLVLSNAGFHYEIKNAKNEEAIKPIKYEKKAIKDGFGRGYAHTFTYLAGSGLKVSQVFFIYPNKEYFLTQVVLVGSKLESNNIIPLAANLVALHDNARSLFVPFDNDTFISYDSKPLSPGLRNSSSEVSVVYNDASRKGFIAGSIEHEDWKSGVILKCDSASGNYLTVKAGFSDVDITRDPIAHGFIKGNTIKSPKVLLGYFDDWRIGMETYAKANQIAEPRYVYKWDKPTPVGWNSWGVIQEKLTLNKALAVTRFFANNLKGFRSGGTAYIDLDSFWDNLTPNHLDFSKLKDFADSCKARGLEPGIYWAPFTDWGWKNGPDRKVEGSNFSYGDLWTRVGNNYHEIDGARALDPTHPGTRQRIDYFVGKFRSCGFRMIKIDFLGHAAAESTHFYDQAVTTGMQAYKKGMEYLVNKLGDQMLIYAAISPSLATGRYVHSRRIACDAFNTIDHTKYSLNSVTYGWWQTYLYDFIDADHVVLAKETEGTNKARFLSAVITGTCFTGDDFSVNGQWTERANQLYQNQEILKIVKNGKAFMPLETPPGTEAAEIFTRRIGKIQYVALFNYTSKNKKYRLNLKRLGIIDKKITAEDLFDHHTTTVSSDIDLELPGSDATIIKITTK